MWTLEEIREEYDRLDRYLGIDTRAIRLSFSKRMRQQHGVCCFRGGHPTEIRLADFLRAHAAAALLTGQRHGHDALWKSLCVRIGCRPERLAEQAAAQAAKNAGRSYVVRCKTCGAESHYLRRGAFVQSIEQGRQDCRCRRCGGRTFALERMRPDGL